MKNLAIARRYAKALLLIGKENGETETYKDELAGFSALVEKEKTLEQAINNPLYNAERRKKLLESILEKLALSGIMKSFLALLSCRAPPQLLQYLALRWFFPPHFSQWSLIFLEGIATK